MTLILFFLKSRTFNDGIDLSENLSCIEKKLLNDDSFTFYAIGDFGFPTAEICATALIMNEWSNTTKISPLFILALGDNFYPDGVDSVDDIRFKTQWSDVFLVHKVLQVPWKVCLGNHDYRGDPQAQIEYTNSSSNYKKLWQMPSKNYHFTKEFIFNNPNDNFSIDFFCLDTNGCQRSVRVTHPELQYELKDFIIDLNQKLMQSTARWKVVYGHHPFYTKGRHHGVLGRCLKDDKYTDKDGQWQEGYGLEKVLECNGVDAYISGHEHVFQHHFAPIHGDVCTNANANKESVQAESGRFRGVHHFVAGAAGYKNRLYGGADEANLLDWVDETATDGFLSVTVRRDALLFQFISNRGGAVLKEVQITK